MATGTLKEGDFWRRIILNKSPWPRRLTLVVDVDANPISALQRILQILWMARTQRADFGFADPVSPNTRRIFERLSSELSSYVEEGSRLDFSQDEMFFAAYDLKKQGKSTEEIASVLYPSKYRRLKRGASEDGDLESFLRNIRNYSKRAESFIDLYPRLVVSHTPKTPHRPGSK